LILLGTFNAQLWMTIIAASGLVLSAVYSLRIVQKIFLGPPRGQLAADLSGREMMIMAALTISIVWLGLFPQPVINTARPAIVQLVQMLEPGNSLQSHQSYVK
jgi:NADH-quinone oxidoreductase subunit M